ncbi:MAG: PLDc_N domain-containing protein [Actinomycetaceae bacterium]|nr:PLDc_N domain-containing protein [Actinomycetaceae bacterium]
MPRVILVLLVLAVWIYGIIHCALTKSDHMPGRVPKWGWLTLNILVPVLGAALWFVALYMARSTENEANNSSPLAPDDDPDFLAHLEKENQFRQWERDRQSGEKTTADDILKRLEEDFDED